MSKFVALARAHWAKHRPQELAMMSERDFEEIGAQMEVQVQELQDAISGPDRPGESYLQKVARLNTARMTAESEVLRQVLPDPEAIAELEDDEEVAEDLRQAHNQSVLREARFLEQALAEVSALEIQDEVAEERELQATVERLRREHEIAQTNR